MLKHLNTKNNKSISEYVIQIKQLNLNKKQKVIKK